MTAPPMSQLMFRRNEGGRCPSCRAGNIDGDGSPELDTPIVHVPTRCLSCGATWRESYRLAGYDDLDLTSVDG